VLQPASAFKQLHGLLLPSGQLANKLGRVGEREGALPSGYGRRRRRL
jgi:hypothetical protein